MINPIETQSRTLTPKDHTARLLLDTVIGGFELYTHRNTTWLEIGQIAQNLSAELNLPQGPQPAIFAINHIDAPEIFWAARLAYQVAGGDASRLVLPVSEKYTHFRHHPPLATAVALAKHGGGVGFLPVEQAYRVRRGDLIGEIPLPEDAQIPHIQDEAALRRQLELGKEFMKILPQLLLSGKFLIISPEGHRDIKLNPAETGTGVAILKMQQLIENGEITSGLIVPIGIQKLVRKPGQIRRQYAMTIGIPLSPGQLITRARELSTEFSIPLKRGEPTADIVSHALMLEIASLLPGSQQGVYSRQSPYFEDVLHGIIKLGTQNGGKRVGLIYTRT
jgi:hypothetical protein